MKKKNGTTPLPKKKKFKTKNLPILNKENKLSLAEPNPERVKFDS